MLPSFLSETQGGGKVLHLLLAGHGHFHILHHGTAVSTSRHISSLSLSLVEVNQAILAWSFLILRGYKNACRGHECAGPGYENACSGQASASPDNESAVEAVRVLLKAVRLLLKAVRMLLKGQWREMVFWLKLSHMV